MDCIEALKTRRSVRAYTGEPVSREVIEDIIDCGRLAATAINIQALGIRGGHGAGDAPLDRRHSGVWPLHSAGRVCVVVMCKETKYYLEDGCNASQNILVAARAHGLGSCWVAGDKKPYARRWPACSARRRATR